jgi:aminoglycoside phosphotransferase family enzyme/predicted kinase
MSRSNPSEAEQRDTIAFLQGLGPCAQITTHASHVLLYGERVLKLKRALRYAYLDFSTPEKRIADCERELAINRRFTPRLYLGLRRITRAPDGALTLDGEGEVVDGVVEMLRFKDEDLFSRVVEEGRATPALVTRLAEVIAASHEAAEVASHGGAEAFGRVLALNEAALRASAPVALERIEAFCAGLRALLDRHAALLDARCARGCVRRCHGDLTLRNICLFEGEPALFDALEFDEGLATIDVLYDLAFPLMDLWRMGARDLANLLFNRTLDARDEGDGLPLLPLFMATRAVVRAHVTAALAKEAPERLAEAQGYFALAESLLEPRKPLLVALGGFSGSGKSTLSAHLASTLGPAPGARIHATDRIRKALHGVAATDKLPPEAYAPDISALVYAREREACAAALRAGHGCIAEAVFDRAQDRAAIEAVAQAAGVPFAGFWLEAPVEVLAQRIAGRRGDPSDADEAVMLAQVARGNEGVGWTRLDAAQGVGAMVGEALRIMALLP